nr:MAG TPA: hypothetical protein [Bacteriophage sp.]
MEISHLIFHNSMFHTRLIYILLFSFYFHFHLVLLPHTMLKLKNL